MRSALAHQIGRPERPFRAGRGRGGFGGHAFVGIAAVIRSSAKTIAEPSQRKTGGLRHAHDVPAVGDGVAERVQPALRIECGTIRCSENDAGRADRCANDAGTHNSHSDCACGLIACARYGWRADFEAGGLCAFLGKLSAYLRRFVERGKPFLRDFRAREDFNGPAAVGHIEHQCSGRVGHVYGVVTG